MCQRGANRNTSAMSPSRLPRSPNRGVVNRRPQLENIIWGRRAAWSPLWCWPCPKWLLPSSINRIEIFEVCLLVQNTQPWCYISNLKEELTNCGTKAADLLDHFLPANFNANPLNILAHLQQLWLHNAYQFKVLVHLSPFARNLEGQFWDSQFWGLGECKRVGICTNWKPTSQYKVLFYLTSFGSNSNVKLWSLNSIPRLGDWVDLDLSALCIVAKRWKIRI